MLLRCGTSACAVCRAQKRSALVACAPGPPYKLVCVGAIPQTIPVVLYSLPDAAHSQRNPKRRCLGHTISAFSTPWLLLTSTGSRAPIRSPVAKRSLFSQPVSIGGTASNGQTMASHRERVADWHREQRELLKCVLQQQVANLRDTRHPAEGSQVCLCNACMHLNALDRLQAQMAWAYEAYQVAAGCMSVHKTQLCFRAAVDQLTMLNMTSALLPGFDAPLTM